MPARVYRGKSAFEYRPPGGGCVRLCALTANRSDVWQRYHALHQPETSVAALVHDYLASARFKELARDTQRSYSQYASQIVAVFGKMEAKAVKPEHVRFWMDERGKAETRRSLANRELAFFGAVCTWGYERGRVVISPCKGIRRFPEKHRERYVADEEYAAVYAMAPTHVRAAMEIAYLCAARLSDVLRLSVFDIRDQGLRIRQGKTGKEQIKAWTPRLRAAVELAQAQPSTIKSEWVLHTRKGSRYSRNGFSTAWQRAKRKAGASDWTFHDLKAKGITDYTGDRQQFSGHKTRAMVEVYTRKPDVVPSLDRSEYTVVGAGLLHPCAPQFAPQSAARECRLPIHRHRRLHLGFEGLR